MPSARREPVRVFRCGAPGASSGALVLQDGERRLDLGDALARLGLPASLPELAARGFFARDALERLLREFAWKELAALPGPVAVPLPPREVGKVLALGKNFREHAAEFAEAVPEEPLFFAKLPETLVADGATVRVPSWYRGRVDHEAELAVVIAKEGAGIEEGRAMEHVAGWTVANDLTLRSLQGRDRELRHPWFRAKNFDGACPLGPCFVPREWLDAGGVRVRARVNGEVRQDASTADFVISVPGAVAMLSRHLTLRAGDVVLMGTPAGVSALGDGDVVECEVEGVGVVRTRIARGG